MKAFSDLEKERVRAALLAEGRVQFARYGLSKTTIRGLAKAAGISAGAFYLFFPSKEDLYLEILSAEIGASRGRFLSSEKGRARDGEVVRSFLRHAVADIRTNPIIRILLEEGDRESFRGTLADRLVAGPQTGIAGGLFKVVEGWSASGAIGPVRPAVVVRTIQLLFAAVVDVKGDPEAHAAAIDLLIECIAAGLAAGKE